METAQTVFKGIYKGVWERFPLKTASLKKDKTALVVMDMVNGFVREGNMKNALAEDIIPPIIKCMKFFKEKDMPIIAFADAHEPNAGEFKQYVKHCIKGTSESEIVDEIKEEGGYKLIEKNSTNGFLEEEFQNWLKENPEITDFVVTGVCTDICVMQFCMTLKAWFNKNNIESRIILTLDTVETYDLGTHQITLVNAMSIFFMEELGIEICREIEYEL